MPHPRKVLPPGLAGAPLALAALLAGVPCALHAQEHPLGARSVVKPTPLQKLVGNRRPPGQLYLSIPFAEVYGSTHGYAPYCSPQIRTTNASNRTVEEMLAGIRYRDARGRIIGSTITRFFLLKVAAEETRYFANVDAPDCNGLTGEVEVIRCVYEGGEPCAGDVVAVNYGAIPLVTGAASKESK